MNFLQLAIDGILSHRASAENTAHDNQTRAREIPEIDDIERQISLLKIQRAKAIVNNSAYSELDEKQQILHQTRLELYKKNNIDIQSLIPSFACPLCQDKAFVGNKPCSCLTRRMNELLLSTCGLPQLELPTFAEHSIDIFPQSEQIRHAKIVHFAQTYASDYPNVQKENIIFCGKSGTGKSFLAGCMISKLKNRGINTLFLSAFSLNSLFMRYINSRDTDRQFYLDILLHTDVIVFDDLGSEPMIGNITKEYLLLVLSTRLNAHRATIITTNFSPEQLNEKYGEKIFSRLYSSDHTRLINVNSKDLRLAPLKKQSSF